VTKSQRHKMELNVSRLTGLELWLIGELEYSQTELEDMVLALKTRLAAIAAVVFAEVDTDPEGVEPPWYTEKKEGEDG